MAAIYNQQVAIFFNFVIRKYNLHAQQQQTSSPYTMEKYLFPAIYIQFPPGYEYRRAAFYLAAEEYIATNMPEGNYMLTWQIGPTVVMGRNQDAKVEMDLPFCRTEGIDVIRRKSGGGSIYADRGNIMTSLITGNGAVEPIFAEYSAKMAECLSALGADVEVSGRNDIRLSGGGKICGNAFYHLSDRNIAHGTLLYDTDARLMRGALTPEKAKLQSKGVKSVESRISLLKDSLPEMDIETVRKHICRYLSDRTILISDSEIRKIQEIENGYYSPDYLYGKDATIIGEVHGSRERIEGCGTVSLDLYTTDGMVTAASVGGDYFEFCNANALFNKAFYGCSFNRTALLQASKKNKLHSCIRGLEESSLCRLIENLCG